MKALQLVLIVFFTLTATGCDTGPELTFTYEESSPGQVVTPSVDATSLSQNEIVFVGQFNTPLPCYRLTGDVDVSDGEVTLTVNARQTQTTNCEQIIGRFIYQGSIRRLDTGTYQVVIRHRFDKADWPDQEFNLSITVR